MLPLRMRQSCFLYECGNVAYKLGGWLPTQGVQFANGKLAARKDAEIVAVHRSKLLCELCREEHAMSD